MVGVLSEALGTDVRSLLAQHLEAAKTAEQEKAAEPPTPGQSWEQLRKARAANATAENKRKQAEKHRDKLKGQLDAANTKLDEATEEQDKCAQDLMQAKASFLKITPPGERRQLLEEAGFDELLAQAPDEDMVIDEGEDIGAEEAGEGEAGGQGLDQDDQQDRQQLVRMREELSKFSKEAAERRKSKKARVAEQQTAKEETGADPLGR